MNWIEFACLDWRFASHIATADYYVKTRTAKAYGHTFGICYYTPTEEYRLKHPRARSVEHYKIDGTVYKTRKKLLEALNALIKEE